MSTYEDYADASSFYDATRVPVGVEIVLGALAAGSVPLAEVRLLDAGCGTGNYAAAVAGHVGSITLVDASAEMLARAVAKVADAPGGPAEDHQTARLQQLPFADGTFDAVMVNQVIHHLDAGTEGWPEHRAAFAELARVLRPGGTLVVNTCSQAQVERAYWAFSLIPEGRAAMAARYCPLDTLEQIFTEVGLAPAGRFAPTDATIQGQAYFDPEGPLSEAWRRSDSTWSLATSEELEAMTDKLTALRDEGRLDEYVAQHDADRPDLGQTTFLVARRPA